MLGTTPINTIIQGDALQVLKTLPDKCIQAVCTSPPYYGLRDYGTAKWEDGSPECDHEKAIEEWAYKNFARSAGTHIGQNHQMNAGKARLKTCPACGARRVDNQIGLEETPAQYISRLVAVFAEVWRVLGDDGLFWLNIGDSFIASKTGSMGDKSKLHGGLQTQVEGGKRPDKKMEGLKPKNLMMIPARLAIALQDQGWILRSEIVWSKPNAMPESVKDRPTKAHEMVYMLAKSERYYYDAQAIAEPVADIKRMLSTTNRTSNNSQGNGQYGNSVRFGSTPDGRNARSVWTITTQPYKEAHFACMPPKLAERCILASTRPGDVVLDPFSGAGTTALVANNLNRRYIGIELNPAYVEMSRRRLVQPSLDWTA